MARCSPTEDGCSSTGAPAAGHYIFTYQGQVYQVPNTFAHPGGTQVLQHHDGQDITDQFLAVHGGHVHSEAALELLRGFQTSDEAQAQAAGSEGNDQHIPRQPLVDSTKPVVLQVGLLGSAYSAWVHAPEPGAPRFFRSGALENITKTPWWVVPLIWLPIIMLLLRTCTGALRTPPSAVAYLLLLGVLCWQLIEYCIHRYLFHAVPKGYWAITVHFLFHGCHHKYPSDGLRLGFPPVPAAGIASAILGLLRVLLPLHHALPLFCGVMLGYVAYDCLHYAMHHGARLPPPLTPLKRSHMRHHYADPLHSYGISSTLFDHLFRTLPPALPTKLE